MAGIAENIICIDPGHGGKDPGGGSNSHFKEKDMVLKISKEQRKHFKRNGITVVMTRNDDEYLDSYQRTTRVKRSGAKHCISNHINAGGGEGAEVIHSIYSNGKIAEGILKALVNAGAKYRRYFSKKGSNELDYYFMHRMTGPVKTNIIEYGFADNKSDTRKILNDWKKYAEVVAKYYIEHVFKKEYKPKSEVKSMSKNTSKYVLTGGLNYDMITEVTRYVLKREWWARINFDGEGNNPELETGGLGPKELKEFEEWLKERGWWYKVKER
ncbi:N-acetylmuramoyl-L-alanine amidase [Salinibacillus xinjiangensis]|uniref:N-acetylmuramoyl-L-alanine amidase n=1 Tax=Salinibacillus xinjiangensis TaxID=1229268 RepID=A0A6G1X7U8_9BACI|nr:N-acetylmuramoyl-L-alanine amidase [Salinibacillus xinjiangensis]MRG87017.1 N-acetylmuramoyl-L-alanine amidase [Salinibacillus xinjiangensis]